MIEIATRLKLKPDALGKMLLERRSGEEALERVKW